MTPVPVKKTLYLFLCILGFFAFIINSQNRSNTTLNTVKKTNQPTHQPALAKRTQKQQQVFAKHTSPSALTEKQTPTGKLTYYLSRSQSGIIGKFEGKEFDNPADNVFSVQIDKQLSVNSQAFLCYTLTGVDDYTNIACSVNDRQAMGGYLVKTNKTSSKQRVQISIDWLKNGANRILFGLADNAGYGYKISDLSIEVIDIPSSLPVVVNKGLCAYDNKAYIHGFVVNKDVKAISIGNKRIDIHDGEFECITELDGNNKTELSFARTNGLFFKQQLSFDSTKIADKEFAFESKSEGLRKIFEKNESDSLRSNYASLNVSKEALKTTREFSLTNLRNIDLPAMDMAMTNVTSENKGVRLLPHGEHFEKPATVAIKYDRTKIPTGYTENDIRTFYFDPTANHWVALERDTVNKELCMVVSETTHFTDMINGVIKTPESPQTEGFTPTMMNDIKAADPASKIQLIAPPTANNQGSANLSYDLEMPPARNGISPKLTIQYNSDGGSGWLGEGWDLNVPSITVDTRWGVPRYDPLYETETYSMGGTMLATVVNTDSNSITGATSIGHKGVLLQRLKRTEGVQFHPVTENSFSLITRLYDDPNIYVWQVLSKDGIKYTYGDEINSRLQGDVKDFKYISTEASNQKKDTATQKGVIAEWKLSRVEDQYRNYCKYSYTCETPNVHGSKSVTSNCSYLNTIQIGRSKDKTVTNSKDTIYQEIYFYPTKERLKQTSSGRYGFLTSNPSKMLDSIKIKQFLPDKTQSWVRTYKFSYINGPFSTQLLSKISQCDSSSKEVAAHVLSYYDNVANSYYNKTEEIIKTTSVEIDNPIPATTSGLPALGGTKSNSSSASFYLGASAEFKLFGFGFSAGLGYNYSFSNSSSDTKMMMIDINGDGLPDKLYKGTYLGKESLCFVPNLGDGRFAESSYPISGYTGDISFTKTSSHTNGWRGSASVGGAGAGVTAEAGSDDLTSSSETSTFLSDVNSDGLIDIVSDRTVYFNYISTTQNGIAIPAFTTNSGLTSRPILNIKTPRGRAKVLKISDNFVGNPTPSPALVLDPVNPCDFPILRDSLVALREKIDDYEQVPMQDIVRVWEAPYPGNITISSHIKYLGDALHFVGLDGVRMSIQTNDSEIWVDSIKPTSTNCNCERNPSISIPVVAGQRIYFRLQSGSNYFSDFLEDAVLWQQTITYSNNQYVQRLYQHEGYTNGVFKSSEANFVSQNFDNVVDSVSNLTITGCFSKPVTNDSVFLKFYISTDSLLSRDSVAMRVKTDTIKGFNNTVYLANDTSYVKYKVWYKNDNYIPDTLWWESKYGPAEITLNNLDVDFILNELQVIPFHCRFEISSNVNEAWDKIIWKPLMSFRRLDKDTVLYAGVKYDLFTQKYQPDAGMSERSDFDTSIINDRIVPSIELQSYRNINTKYTVCLYNNDNNLLVKKFFGRIVNNNSVDSFEFARNRGLIYYFTVYINDTIHSDSVTATFKFRSSSFNYTPIIYCKQSLTRTLFGHLWRGWGQFQYNASCGRFALPIKEDSLYMPADMSNQAMQEKWGIKKMCMFNMSHKPYKKSYYWTGSNDHLLIKGDTICTGRLNLEQMPTCIVPLISDEPDYVRRRTKRLFVSASTEATSTLSGGKYEIIERAPVLSNRSTATTSWGGASANIGSVSAGGNYTWSNGQNTITSAYMDLNGDGFPDYITDSKVEYTNQIGGRDGEIASLVNESSDNNSKSFGFNGGYTASQSVSDDGAGAANISSNLSKDLNANIGLSVSTNNTVSTNCYIDLNGDGLPDRVYKDKSKIYVCLNQGYHFSPPVDWGLTEISVSQSSSISFSSPMPGDPTQQLMDLIMGNGGKLVKWLKKINLGVSSGVSFVKTTSYTLCNLCDVNMDGLPDKVFKNKASDKVAVQFNTGNGFSSAITLEQMEDLFKSVSSSMGANLSISVKFRIFLVIKLTISASGNMGWTTDYSLNQLMDIDGDGYPDIIKASDDVNRLAELKVKRSLIGFTNKLATVTNPLGAVVRLQYARSKPSYDHPGGKWVMSAVSVNDGIADDGDSLRNVFAYNNGKYDRSEREFLGFGQVITDNLSSKAVYRRTRQNFDNSNFYTRGTLLSTEVDGVNGTTEKVYNQSTNKYYTYLISRASKSTDENFGKYKLTSAVPETTFTKENMFLNQYIVYSPVKYTKNTVYEYPSSNQQSLITSETYSEYNTTFGTHGELSLYKFSDKGALGDSSYNYRTEISYLTNKPTMSLFVLPKRISVIGSDNKIYRVTEAVWNDDFASQLRQVKNVNAPGDTAITEIGYDRWGNINAKVLPGSDSTKVMWYKYDYDKYYHLFLCNVYDHLGYKSFLRDYNYKYGFACKHYDECYNIMTYKLDNLGRIISITGANEYNEKDPSVYTLKFDYHPEITKTGKTIIKPAYAVTKHFDPSNLRNDLETVTFVDGIGRPIQVKKDGFIDGVEKMIVSGRAKYDEFGRAIEAYYPVVENKSAAAMVTFNPTFDTQKPTRTEYDVLDRTTKVTLPDGNVSSTVYGIANGLLQKTIIDALNHKQNTYVNGGGKTIRTVQYHNNDSIITAFGYDAIDQLISVTDAKGGVTTSVYDKLGRRTQVTHPASGTTKFEYDIASNLIAKQTANMIASGKKIRYYYRCNRLDSITYPDHPENNVRYVYGTTDDNSGRNIKGRLSFQIDGSGVQQFSYGKMGEITELTRSLMIPNTGIATFTTKWNYDSWNRVKAMTYPDGEVLTYNYNVGGLLDKLTGLKTGATTIYIDSIKYDKFEQRTRICYGNGTATNYTYDPRNRNLNNLLVTSAATKTTIMNNTYQYDNVNNVLGVTNSASALTNGLCGTMEHHYGYDDLYRLTTANGTYKGASTKAANYSLNMQYDNLHNITYKKQAISQTNIQFTGMKNTGYILNYGYEQNPQQISSIADSSYCYDGSVASQKGLGKRTQNYSYDANGNLTYVNTASVVKGTNAVRKLLWDEENRLLALSDNGYVSNYWYDAAGERTVKMTGDGNSVFVNGMSSGANMGNVNFTAYVNPYLVVGNGANYTKHIYIGSQRIVSKLCDPTSVSNPLKATRPSVIGFNYANRFKLMTDSIVARYRILGVSYAKPDTAGTAAKFRGTANPSLENLRYFYHPDHLGSSSLITDANGDVAQHLEYVPFGEVFIDERPATSSWKTPYKFNAKELDEETGLYYYGARYYDPRTSVWLSVDPLAEKYAGRSSYEYCLSNPVAYIDHDGRFSKKWMANLSRNWYNLWHKDKASPIMENKDATKSQFKYTYQTASKENGECVITSHYKFDKKGAQSMQNVGDGVAVVGYAATLSVVGAEAGVPLAAAGNAISLAGNAWELSIDLLNADWGDSGKKIGFFIGGELLKAGLKKVLPGAGKKIGEKGFDLGTEILMQSSSLKASGIERVTDTIIEKKNKEKKNKE